MDADHGTEQDGAGCLEHLMSASLDRVMVRPLALDTMPDSEGMGHLPFAAWLVLALRPALVVGATMRRPAFHAALCQAMAQENVAGEAIAISLPGRAMPGADDLNRSFPDLAGHVRLSDPGESLPFPHGSVTLLHADPDLWREVGDRWRRALSPGGVLVLHGLAGTDPDGLMFTHDGGLLVRCAGDAAPASVGALCRIAQAGGPMLARLRARFGSLGERWRQEAIARREASTRLSERGRLLDALRDHSRLAGLQAACEQRVASLERRLAEVEAERRDLEARLAAASGGRRRWLSARPRAVVRAPVSRAVPGRRRIEQVLFVSGEPETAGSEFRARRASLACAATGRRARWIRIEQVDPEALVGVDLLVLWRSAWTVHVETMVGLARGAGALIAFDVDDLVVEPALARPDVIDAMRTTGIGADLLSSFFAQMRSTLLASDVAIATTDELAGRLRAAHPVAHVVPNGFDEAAHDLARLERRARSPDGLVRIGYAAGTQTHQRDFAVAADAVADVLRARPRARLVLFRDATGRQMLITDEFPALAAVSGQIEWRDTVPVELLPAEIARFDIAICPLEPGNVFCECKSEIKFVEAALAEVPCVASPSGPFSRAIAHGRTGWLANDASSWRDALLTLVDAPERRAALGFAAYCSVLWRFGPARQAESWDGILRGLEGGREAALQHELRVRRGGYAEFGTPVVPQTDVVFDYDSLRQADVAVAITSFDYERFIEEALDSAATQTLGALELVVVDDCSTDGSVDRVLAWVRRHHRRFTRVRVERSRRNAGLGPARNAAFAAAESRHVMSLDADNRLLPGCCEALLALLLRERAAFAYPALRMFGDPAPPVDRAPYDPARLVGGNMVDAMALVAKWAWAAAGGYYDRADARGWEDYGLWCRLAELGQFGVRHGDELAEYRVHAGSMTNRVTETADNKRALVAFVEERHPWVRLRSRVEQRRVGAD